MSVGGGGGEKTIHYMQIMQIQIMQIVFRIMNCGMMTNSVMWLSQQGDLMQEEVR